MPPEIADSDAESDFGSPMNPQAARIDGEAAQQPQNSPSLIDFDQFLDPTQRLSSSASHQVIGSDQLDGPSDQITHLQTRGWGVDTQLTSASDMSLAAKSKKRAHSALQESSKDSAHHSSNSKSKSKRSKTYGAKSKSRLGQDENLFPPPLIPSTELEPLSLTTPNATSTDQHGCELERASAESTLPKTTSSSGHPDSTSLLGPPTTDATPLMTTSMASMGQYKSINLDFRGGFGVNANPFGSLSQVSLEEDPIQAGTEVISNVLAASEGQVLQNNTHLLNFSLMKDQPLPATTQSSPDRPMAINPAQLMQGDVSESAADVYNDASAMGHHHAEASLPSMEKPPPPKKRGRKAKNSRLTSKSPAPSLGEDADEFTLPDLPLSTRSRQGTVDSVSQASEMSGPIASTRKRKRGISDQAVEKAQTESSPLKLPTSEPNLSDEAFVGLPKESYKPRPSRSRSKITMEEPQPKPDELSLAKEARSEPGLSDEAVVGLPKENYKPRPSRSRAKKVDDMEVPDLPLPEPKVDHRTPAKNTATNVAGEETPAIATTKSSDKKGRKAKVKRAKTSAAALLKKTDLMLSEGEEDVVWMDTKPAPVKLDLPPDLKALKKEPDPPQDKNDDHEDADKSKKGKGSSNITIEIPNNSEAWNPVAEPKKRGRKPKKAQQKSEERIVDEDEEEQPQQDNKDSRPPLAEKSSNSRATTGKKSTCKDPKKTPTVSPFSSPEPEARPHPQPNDIAAKDKGNQPLTTPAKSKSAAPPSEKGPTKHSPINPPSASNSGRKSIYRIGLSRRQHIPSLLRKVDRAKPPPKNVAIKQKELKVKGLENEDGEYKDPSEMRGADGMLVEWEF